MKGYIFKKLKRVILNDTELFHLLPTLKDIKIKTWKLKESVRFQKWTKKFDLIEDDF